MGAKGLILANAPEVAGVGPLDRTRARHLLPVANRPILAHALEGMRRAGIDDVAIAVAEHTEDAVRDAVGPDVAVTYVSERHAGGAADAVLAAEDFLDGEPFVLQHGDGLLHDDLRALVRDAAEDAADAVVLVCRDRGLNGRPGLNGARHRNGAVNGVQLAVVGSLAAPGPGLAVAGAQLFGPGFLSRARRRLRGAGELAPVLDDLRRDGARVEVRMIRGWRRFVGHPHELLEMNRAVLDQLEEPVSEPDLPDCQIQGRVHIHPDARVETTVIRGPAVIGAGAHVRDAYVGPYTAIGEGVRIEGAEIEHSIVLAGATILHIGGRLEASVVGRDARVVRDFSLPRALRLHIGDGAEVALR